MPVSTELRETGIGGLGKNLLHGLDKPWMRVKPEILPINRPSFTRNSF